MAERYFDNGSGQAKETPVNDTAHFSKIFKMYYSRLCLFSFQIIGDMAIAEDISQEALIKYWDQRGNIAEPEGAVKNYLYTTVRNACISTLRHDKVVKKYAEEQEADPAEEITMIHSMIRAEVVAEIHSALETLPHGCRQVVQLAYLEGLKNKEIAAKLGISVNTVKTQRQRALQLLRSRVSLETFAVLLLMNNHLF